MKGFFHGAVAFFKKVFTSHDWTHAAQTTLVLASPLVETLFTVVGGAQAGSDAAHIMNTVKSDFGVLNATITQVQQSPGNAGALTLMRNVLGSIKDNIAGLEQVAQVNDPATKEKVTTTATLLIGELDAILQSIPAA